jgi:hypothetical protein
MTSAVRPVLLETEMTSEHPPHHPLHVTRAHYLSATRPPSRLTRTSRSLSPPPPQKPHEISESEKASEERQPQRTLAPHLFQSLSVSPLSPSPLPERKEKLGFLLVSPTPRPRSERSLLPCLPSLPLRWQPPPASSESSAAASFPPQPHLSAVPLRANGGKGRERPGGGGAAGGRAPPRRVRSGLRVLVPRE